MRYFFVRNEVNYGRGRFLMTEIEKDFFNPVRRKPYKRIRKHQRFRRIGQIRGENHTHSGINEQIRRIHLKDKIATR